VTLSYLGYLAFTAVLVATPGATTAVVVRNTLAGGRRAGLAAALGAALANSTHAAAAGLGLAVLVTRWPDGLAAIRLVGALYLAWLGARSLARAVGYGRSDLMVSGDSDVASRAVDHRPSFREGLAVNLLNPAIITFYLVAVPTFMPAGAARGYYLLLAGSHVLMAFGVHAVWVTGFDRLRETFAPPIARRWLEGVTGAALVALAVVIFVRR
jgi:threonine/homoserine/homoserine lactone efflux protein